MEHTISTQEMESVKALSDVNIKISEAQNLLFKLQEQETEYLVVREKKAMDRIQKVVEVSKAMVTEADQNHAQIKALLSGISEFVSKLLKARENFTGLLAEFEERNIEWEKDIGKQQDQIIKIHQQLKIEKIQIKNDKESLESARNKLADDQRKLDSDRGTLQRTITRLNIKNL